MWRRQQSTARRSAPAPDKIGQKGGKGEILWAHTYPTVSSRPRGRCVQSLVPIGSEMWICIRYKQTCIFIYKINIFIYIWESWTILFYVLGWIGWGRGGGCFNPLNTKLNPICHLLALLGAHPILHVSRIRVNVNVGGRRALARNETAVDLSISVGQWASSGAAGVQWKTRRRPRSLRQIVGFGGRNNAVIYATLLRNMRLGRRTNDRHFLFQPMQ